VTIFHEINMMTSVK